MPSSAVLRSSTTVSRVRHGEQVRGFHSGWWSSLFDPAAQRESRRRHRMLRQAYVERLNRQLSWDREYTAPPHRFGGKTDACKSWLSGSSRPTGRHIRLKELRRWAPHLDQSTYRSVVADFNSFLRSNQKDIWETLDGYANKVYGKPTSSTDAAKKPTTGSETRASSAQQFSSTAATFDAEPEFDIDPITNRKVFRKSDDDTRTNLPLKKSKSRSQSTQDHLTQSSKSVAADEIADELARYTPFKYNEPDGVVGQKADPVAQGLEAFDTIEATEQKQALSSKVTAGSTHNETQGEDGGITKWFQRLSETVLPQETAKPSTANSTSAKDPELELYTPFMHNEPDGHKSATVDTVADGLKDFDNKLQEGNSVTAEYKKFILKETQGLDDYKPFFFNEADAQPSTTKDSRVAQEVRRYQPFSFNEPDGQKVQAEDTWTERLADSHYYKPYKYNEPDGKKAEAEDTWAERLPDSVGYKPFGFNEPHGRVAEPIDTYAERYPESLKYEPFMFNEPHGQITTPEDTYAERYPDCAQYKPFAFNEPDGQVPTIEDPRIQHAKDSADYKPFMFSEPDGHLPSKSNTVIDSLKRFDTVHNEAKRSAFKPEVTRYRSPASNEQKENLDNLTASEVRASVGKPRQSSVTRKMTGNFVRDFPEDFSTVWTTRMGSLSPASPLAPISPLESIKRQYATESSTGRSNANRLQTSLERTEGNSADQSDPYSKTPQGLETCYSQECEAEFGGQAPQFSAFYGNSQDSVANDAELEKEIRQIYESSYGMITTSHRQTSTESSTDNLGSRISSATAETSSTVYKVLAYDPVSQTVDIAETSSIVPDHSKPLTPAEALLRISNPAKFFPHLKALQLQGFEIVSGGGDVLVFRKVRDASSDLANELTAVQQRRKHINPVDGMHSQPATGNFASPTGFVNYDTWVSEPGTSTAAFKSGIDVRREEPVFSGPKKARTEDQYDADGSRISRRNLGRRVLLTATWVAACSYAIGVVAEYFSTGGIDGKGPVGF